MEAAEVGRLQKREIRADREVIKDEGNQDGDGGNGSSTSRLWEERYDLGISFWHLHAPAAIVLVVIILTSSKLRPRISLLLGLPTAAATILAIHIFTFSEDLVSSIFLTTPTYFRCYHPRHPHHQLIQPCTSEPHFRICLPPHLTPPTSPS